jgi:ferredoxin
MSWNVIGRGDISKRDLEKRTVMQRRLLVKKYEMELDRDTCIGCGICADICPKEAIKYQPAEFKGMRALSRPSIDFDQEKCVLCGECVSMCPMHALKMRIEQAERVPVIEMNVFALATRKRW